jgi:hypothetical protein
LTERSRKTLLPSWRFILALWLPVWFFFLVWPLWKDPSKVGNTFRLLRAGTEARRTDVYGSEFVAFLRFCKEKLPAGSTFRLVGIDYASIEKVRAFYFLYPNLVAEHPQFILVYRSPGHQEANARLYASLNSGTFILRSTEPAIP